MQNRNNERLNREHRESILDANQLTEIREVTSLTEECFHKSNDQDATKPCGTLYQPNENKKFDLNLRTKPRLKKGNIH